MQSRRKWIIVKQRGNQTTPSNPQKMNKITLHTKAVNGGAFNCRPAMIHEIEPENALANNVIFDGEFNPHNVRLFVIGHEFGAIAALWAEHDQEAFDILCDENLSGAFLEEDQNQDNESGELAHLGNAGELHNLDSAWCLEVEFKPERDWKVMLKFAEARGGNYENLDKV